jgi:hypothetical protein
MNLMVSTNGSGTKMIWTRKYSKMDRNGTINKNVFFLLIAKNKQTTVNNKKNNNKPRPLLRVYVSVIIFVVK